MSTQPYFEAIARQMPQARYVLPDFEERTAYGFRRQNPYTKLFEDRIVFLGVQVDDASADDVMAQLLVLESQDPDSLITMYINSPGGSFTALTAIYDTMQYIKPQIQTVCLGQAPRLPPCCWPQARPASVWRCPTPASSFTSRRWRACRGRPRTSRSSLTRSTACACGSRTPSRSTRAKAGGAGAPRHRARQDPHRPAGRRVWPDRPGAGVPQGSVTLRPRRGRGSPLTCAVGATASLLCDRSDGYRVDSCRLRVNFS